MNNIPPVFFLAGGTIPPDAPSYVERSADREILDCLTAGEYCYVLNSRQMGKSSLAVRAISKLQSCGILTAFVDLTRLGSTNLTPEQWYSGLILETGRSLGMRKLADTYLTQGSLIGPAHRYFEFLNDIVAHTTHPIVVMIDEIDVVRSLDFSTDEFFAGIRQMFNARATNDSLGRLSFCLLGAALPSDLVRDTRTTPFNIARNIHLRDFTLEEAQPFGEALGPNGKQLLERVMSWSGGHPFLTQALCFELVNAGSDDVDSLVKERYLNPNARETDTNLADVGNRVLGRGDESITDSITYNILTLYKALRKRGIRDDERNGLIARLKMSGVVKSVNGRLYVRNKIYAETFTNQWIDDNLPHQDLRRQRRAFWKGVLRSGFVGVLITSLLAYLAVNNYRLLKLAEYDAYVANMRLMPMLYEQNDFIQIENILNQAASSPFRGWEFGFWYRLTHRATWSITAQDDFHNNIPLSSDGKLAATVTHDRKFIKVFDLDRPGLCTLLTLRRPGAHETNLFFCNHDRNLEVYQPIDKTTVISTYDLKSRQLLALRTFEVAPRQSYRAELRSGQLLAFMNRSLTLLDTKKLHSSFLRQMGAEPSFPTISPDKTKMAWIDRTTSGETFAVCSIVSNWKEIGRIRISDVTGFPDWLPGSNTLLIPNSAGNVSFVNFSESGTSLKVSKLGSDISSIQASPVNLQFTVVETTGLANIFEYKSGEPALLRTFRDVFFCRYFPDGNSLLTVDDTISRQSIVSESDVPQLNFKKAIWDQMQITRDGNVSCWSAQSRRSESMNVGALSRGVASQSFNPSSPIVFDNRGDSFLRIDADSSKTSFYLRTKSTPLVSISRDLNQAFHGSYCFDYSARTGAIAIKTSDRKVTIFDRNGFLLGGIEATGTISKVQFSFNGKYLGCGCTDGLSIWNATSMSLLWSTKSAGQEQPIFGLFFAENNQMVGAIASPGVARVYELGSGKLLNSIGSRNQRALTGDFSFDCRRVAIGTEKGEVTLFDSQTGQSVCNLGKHAASIADLKYLKTPNALVSASLDGTVKVWKSDEAQIRP